MGRCLGAAQFGVDGVLIPVDDGLDDAVLAVRLLIRLIEGPLGIGFIFGEQQINHACTVEESLPKETMPSGDGPQVRAWLAEKEAHTGADELFVLHGAPTLASRIRSMELIAQ